jgi:hypothetical protein
LFVDQYHTILNMKYTEEGLLSRSGTMLTGQFLRERLPRSDAGDVSRAYPRVWKTLPALQVIVKRGRIPLHLTLPCLMGRMDLLVAEKCRRTCA